MVMELKQQSTSFAFLLAIGKLVVGVDKQWK
jgi:hypothetical protein